MIISGLYVVVVSRDLFCACRCIKDDYVQKHLENYLVIYITLVDIIRLLKMAAHLSAGVSEIIALILDHGNLCHLLSTWIQSAFHPSIG